MNTERINEAMRHLRYAQALLESVGSGSAITVHKPVRPKKMIRRYYNHAKVMAYLRQHPELHSATDSEVASMLKSVGLMSPTTNYGDTTLPQLRYQLVLEKEQRPEVLQ